MTKTVKLGLPKGSLQDATIQLFARAGFNIYASERSYFPAIDDPEIECMLIRAQEMARYVSDGVLDAGLTGQDWIAEHAAGSGARRRVTRRSGVRETELRQSALGSGGAGGFAVQDGAGPRRGDRGHGARARNPGVLRTPERERVNVEFSWGATEVKPPLLADAIVEVTETGSSLRANRLRVIDTVLESNPQFIANREALGNDWKRTKLQQHRTASSRCDRGAREGRHHAERPTGRSQRVLSLLPALRHPTISPLADDAWVALNTIIEERTVRDLIPRLKCANAHGIVEYPAQQDCVVDMPTPNSQAFESDRERVRSHSIDGRRT